MSTVISININIDDQRVRDFAYRFKNTGRDKVNVFVLKNGISGPHLTFLCNNVLDP